MVRSEPGVSLQSATTDLQSVEATLDAVLYNGTTNASALADQINAVTPSISTTPLQSSTLTALANSQVTGSLLLSWNCPSLMSGQCKSPQSQSEAMLGSRRNLTHWEGGPLGGILLGCSYRLSTLPSILT